MYIYTGITVHFTMCMCRLGINSLCVVYILVTQMLTDFVGSLTKVKIPVQYNQSSI
jgi:hypothetical protein